MSTLTTQELQQQYIAYFGRPGDPQGIDYWLNESDIKTAKEFALKISAQDEYSKGIGAEPVADQVNALYVNLFGRNADADGLIYWTNQVTKGVLSLGNLAYDLIVAAANPVEGNEGQAALDASALSKKTAAAQIFTDNVKAGGFILDYDNEAAFAVARTFVSNVKADTQLTLEQLTTATQGQVVAMSNASKAAPASATATEGLSVVEQAQLQAAQAATAASQAQLAVANQAVLDAAAAKAEAAEKAEADKNAPASYKFTKTTDNLSGQGGADVFSGVIQAGTADGTTIFPGDGVDGGGGIDTVSVSVAGIPLNAAGKSDDYTLSAITTDNVEKLIVSNFSTGTDKNGTAGDRTITTFELGMMNGLTTVGVNASGANGDTAFTLAKNFVDLEMRNGAGDILLNYTGEQKDTGLADVQNVVISGMTAGALDLPGIETVNITTEINKSKIAGLNTEAAAGFDNQLETLNISGDQNLTITAGIPFASAIGGKVIEATVDASAASGKINLNVSGSASTLSVTGGSGDDTFNFEGTLTKNDVVDGGDGSDTLLIDGVALTTHTDQVTNFEKFGFNTSIADQTINQSKLPGSISTLIVDGRDADVVAAGITDFTLEKVPAGTDVVIKKTTADQNNATPKVATDGGNAAGQGTSVEIKELSDTDTNSVNIKLDAVGGFSDALINDLAQSVGFGLQEVKAQNYETINLTSATSEDGTKTFNELSTFTVDSVKTLTIDGDANLIINDLTTGALSLNTLDASALTGTFSLLGQSAAPLTGTTYKLPNTQNTLDLGGSLDYLDTITGGSHPSDVLTATLASRTATNGGLKITGIETINLLTTNDNVLDLSGVVGATTITTKGNIQTITGLDLTSNVRIEALDVAGAGAGANADATFKITAADSSGDADTLYLGRQLTSGVNAGAGLNTLESTGIEILDIQIEDTVTAADTSTWNLAKFDGTTIKVTEGPDDAFDANIALGTVHKNVTSIDTSGVKGSQTWSAAESLSAVDAKGSGSDAVDFTTSEWNDTFTISKTGAIQHTINAGDGTDTATVGITTGFIDGRKIAVEKLTLDVSPGTSPGTGNGVGATGGGLAAQAFNAVTTEFTITGGNSLSVFDNETTADAEFIEAVTKVDASGFGGKVALDFDPNALNDTVTISGGSLTTDTARGTFTTAAATAKPNSTGIETLILTSDVTGTGTTSVGLGNASGVTRVQAGLGANDTFVINKIESEKIRVKTAAAGSTLQLRLADDSGAADTLTIELDGTAGGDIAATANIDLTDVETVTIKVMDPEQLSLAGIAMDGAASNTTTLKITGNKALEVGNGTVNGTSVDVDVIDASGMAEGGSFTMDKTTGRTRTKTVTYTGSSGSDQFVMSHEEDVIDGGSEAAGANGDTLVLSNQIELLIGGIIVDLTKSGDQVTTLNGLTNTSVQQGFESVDISAVTAATNGSILTANKIGSTIIGLNAVGGAGGRDIIKGGVGNDDLTGGSGPDKITPGAGINTIRYAEDQEVGEVLDLTETATDTIVVSATSDLTNIGITGSAPGAGLLDGLDTVNIVGAVTATFSADQLTAEPIAFVGGLGVADVATVALDGTRGGTLDASNFTFTNLGTLNLNAGAGTGTDVIIGSSRADVISAIDASGGVKGTNAITPGLGNDTITLQGRAGTPIDTIFGVGQPGQSTLISGTTIAGAILANGDTLSFANGLDTVNVFDQAVDKLSLGAGAGIAPTTLVGVAHGAALIADRVYSVFGTYTAPNFVVDGDGTYAAGQDILLAVGNGTLTMSNHTGYVLFENTDANFVTSDLI